MSTPPDNHWRRKATALGRLLPRARLHPAVLAWADGRLGTTYSLL
ncbi:MAG: hypothetical protein PHE83_12230 [Opitutaceae bacterium]|nr:hypothetical protein [Opitutaceae bacterium]